MTHDPLCKWSFSKRRPLDDDEPGCDDCDLIAKVRKDEQSKTLI